MAETIKEEISLEEFEMKEETVFKEEELLPSSTEEDTCSVYTQGDEIKKEKCELKEKVYIKDEVITPSTDTCTVYIQEEDVKMENTGVRGNEIYC